MSTESVHIILAACVRHLLRDDALWWNISAMTDFSTSIKPGWMFGSLGGVAKCWLSHSESQCWELCSFSKPDFYLKTRGLSQSLKFVMARRKGNSCSRERKNTSSPVKQGYRSKVFPFGLLITATLTDRTAAETANIWGKVQTSNFRPF